MDKRILFICTGNTCRSPMAEGLLRSLAHSAGLTLEVRSAGISAIEGMPISKYSKDILENKGIPGSMTSSPASGPLLEWADLILTMTNNHKRAIIQMFPESVDKTYTLKEYVLDEPSVSERIRERERLIAELQLKLALGQDIPPGEQERLQELEREIPDFDISDPFGGNKSDYERVAAELEACLRRLIARLGNS